MRIPGHFHSTVVGGTALAFMALTYYVLPLIFRRKVAFWGAAKIQPYLFAAGITMMSMGMTFAGIFGVPRRHWDISFADSPFRMEFPPAVDLMMAVVGLGGMLAATAGIIYVLVAVKSVFFGEKLDLTQMTPGMPGVPQGVSKLPSQSHSGAAAEAVHKEGTPGTVILVAVFLVVFILYYFTNWKLLSLIWQVG